MVAEGGRTGRGAAGLSAVKAAVRSGVPAVGALVALSAAVVAASAVLHPALAHPGPSAPPVFIPWSQPYYATGQILIHVVSGFIVGYLAGGLAKGFVGAAFGPLIDVDHLSVLGGSGAFVRGGHSLILLALLVLFVGWAGTWRWGAVDFAFFASAQMTTHFAVAPMGFPLLSPLVATEFVFSRWIPAAVTAAILLGAWAYRSRKGVKGPGSAAGAEV